MEGRITASVDDDVADAHGAVSDGDQRKLDLLINSRLREATQSEQTPRDIRGNAQQREFTPERSNERLRELSVCAPNQRVSGVEVGYCRV